MNYIQRLFDAATPAAPGGAAVPVVEATVGSPLIAADQRLGLFPDLVDPLSAPAGAGDPPAPERSAAPIAREASRDRPTAAATERPLPTPNPPPETRAAATPPATAREAEDGRDQRPERYVSPLQRLAESDPLDPPARRGAVAREQDSRAAPPQPLRSDPLPTTEPPRAAPISPPLPDFAPQPRSAPAPTAPEAITLAAPFRVTADQFQPVAADEPQPRAAAAPTSGDHTAAPSIEPRQDAPTPLPPLEPVARDADSPFARFGDALPPPPAERPAPAPPPPERIIERIRDVSVAPPAPPTAMTAAAQSVIGSLSQRNAAAWQPRQEGF